MSTEKEVSAFLKEFKQKMAIWDVLFRDERGKNAKALVDLELRPNERKSILETYKPMILAKDQWKKNYMAVQLCGYLAKSLKNKKSILKLH